jgi:hypothetical protein
MDLSAAAPDAAQPALGATPSPSAAQTALHIPWTFDQFSWDSATLKASAQAALGLTTAGAAGAPPAWPGSHAERSGGGPTCQVCHAELGVLKEYYQVMVLGNRQAVTREPAEEKSGASKVPASARLQCLFASPESIPPPPTCLLHCRAALQDLPRALHHAVHRARRSASALLPAGGEQGRRHAAHAAGTLGPQQMLVLAGQAPVVWEPSMLPKDLAMPD